MGVNKLPYVPRGVVPKTSASLAFFGTFLAQRLRAFFINPVQYWILSHKTGYCTSSLPNP